MDKELENKVLGVCAAEDKLFKAEPKMKDPEWWSKDGCGEVPMNEHDKQLTEELAEKAGIETE